MTKIKPFEWFYFDVHQPDGYDFVFSFHIQPFMSHFDVCIFDVFIYRNNRLFFHNFLLLSPDALQIEQKGNYIQHEANPFFLLERNPHTLKLSIRGEWLNMDLNMDSDIPLNMPLNVSFPAQSSDLQTFRWQLFMPLATAKGSLQIKSKKDNWQKITINGRGYHDGNSGRFNLKKALNSWLWMKIYSKGALWIAGKIVPRRGQVQNILVRVQPPDIAHTMQADIDLNERSLQINSEFGRQSFELIESYQLDDLRFLIPAWPKAFESFEKIREILAALTLDRKALKPLRNVLTNGKYRRRRWLAKDENGEIIEIFGEEMILNG